MFLFQQRRKHHNARRPQRKNFLRENKKQEPVAGFLSVILDAII